MWNPPSALPPEEHKIAARPRQARKFFVFWREHRHAWLEAPCQDTFTETYRGRSLAAQRPWKLDCWPSPPWCRPLVM